MDEYVLRKTVLEVLFLDADDALADNVEKSIRSSTETNKETPIADSGEQQDYSTPLDNSNVCSICLECLECAAALRREPKFSSLLKASSKHPHQCASSDRSTEKLPNTPIAISRIMIMPSCQHIFHRDCIMRWMLQQHDGCPTCRRPLWESETYTAIESSLVERYRRQHPTVPPRPTVNLTFAPPHVPDEARQQRRDRRRKRLAACIALGLAAHFIVLGGFTLMLIFRPS